jgi:hypothetical protein
LKRRAPQCATHHKKLRPDPLYEYKYKYAAFRRGDKLRPMFEIEKLEAEIQKKIARHGRRKSPSPRR